MADSDGAFRLTFVQGRGLLSLGGRDIEGLGRVDALELEIPNLRFPFDLSGGVGRFKNRRLQLRELALLVRSKDLTRMLRRAPLGDFGIFDPHVTVSGAHVRLEARVQIGGHTCEVTLSAVVSPEPPRAARLCVVDVRLYGFLPVPAPLIVTALGAALGAESPATANGQDEGHLPPLLHLRSTSDIGIEACELAMLAILPMHGWRLPERKHVRIRVAGGTAQAAHLPLVFSLAEAGTELEVLVGEDASAEVEPVRAFAGACAPVEAALARGDVTTALALLSAQGPLEAEDRVGTTRLLQLYLAATSSLPQAADLARAALARWPSFVPALLAQAVVAEVGGRSLEAAALYEKVAELSAAQGQGQDEGCAHVAAARAWATAGKADRALINLERGLVGRPYLRPVGRARVMKHAAEGGWPSLLTTIGEESSGDEADLRDEVAQLLELARQGGINEDPALVAQAATSLESLLVREESPDWADSSLSRADAAYQMALVRLVLGEEDAAAYWFGVCIEGDASRAIVALAWRDLVELLRRRADVPGIAQALAGWATDARAPESAAEKVAHLLEAARLAAWELQQPEQAAEYLASALAIAPADEAVLAQLEALALTAGTIDSAIEILRRDLGETRPDQGKPVLRMLIRMLIAAGNRQAEAQEACKVLLELSPDDEEGAFHHARLAWDAGDLDVAGAIYRAATRAASLPPAYLAEADLRLAHLEFLGGHPAVAERHLAQGLAYEPAGARVEVVAETLRVLGHEDRLQRLVAAREAALADDRDRRRMRRSLALAAERRGDLADAERGYLELLQTSPDDLELLELLEHMVALCKRQARKEDVVHWLGRLWALVDGQPGLAGGAIDRLTVGLDLAAALAERQEGKPRAERVLRRLAEQMPAEVAPLDALYQVLVEQGAFAEASDVFAKRLALSEPAAVQVLLVSRARLCLAQPGGERAALEVLQSLPADDLEDDALALRAEIANRAGEIGDAMLCLQRLRVRAGEAERAPWTRRLTEVLSQPRLAKDVAITVLEKLQAEEPADLGVAQALFEAYGRLDDAGARVRLWKALLERVPALPDMDRARLQVAMAEAAAREGDWQAAQAMLDQAAALDASSRTEVERRVAHARLLIAQGELREAEAELVQALELDPDAGAALALLGELAYGAQDWERARKAYTHLAGLPGASSVVAPQVLAYRRAELAEMFGDHVEAEAAYRDVIAIEPGHDGAREALAGFAFLRGDLAEAALHLQEVVRLVPKEAIERLTQVRQRLGQIYLGLGDLQAARQNLELALASEPDRASTLELLATVYGRLGLHRDAASMCERLSRILSDSTKKAEALFRKGEILRTSLADADGAADAYLRACDLDPGFAPTLGRLVSYYWARADLPSLADIGVELVTATPHPNPDEDDLGLLVAAAALLSRHDEGLAQAALESPSLGAPLRAELAAKRLGELIARAIRGNLGALDTVLSFVVGTLAPTFEADLVVAASELLARDPGDAGLAVLLGRLFDRRGQRALARAAYALAHFIDPGLGAGGKLVELGDQTSPRPEGLAPGRAVHPLCRGPLRTILQHLAGALAYATTPSYDEPTAALQSPTLVLCDDLRRQMSAPAIPLVAQGHGADVTFTATQPLTLLIGRRAEALPPGELSFLVARAFEQARAGTLAVLRMSADNLRGLLRAVLRVAGAPATPFEIAEEAADEATSLWLRRLRHPDLAPLLPIAQHRDELIAEAARALANPPDLDDYMRGCRYTADRIGLLACTRPLAALRAMCGLHKEGGKEGGDASTVVARQEHLRSSQALHELVAFMLSDEYAALVNA